MKIKRIEKPSPKEDELARKLAAARIKTKKAEADKTRAENQKQA